MRRYEDVCTLGEPAERLPMVLKGTEVGKAEPNSYGGLAKLSVGRDAKK